MRTVIVPAGVVQTTLAHLQEAGKRHKECVVLWLAEDQGADLLVRHAHLPDQVARADIFRIPPPSMRAILQSLSQSRLMIAAQVHSHPNEAFHSPADDAWAIVRHLGALSLVVPYFALKTTVSTFREHTKVFCLAGNNRWHEIPAEELHSCLRFI